MDQQHPWQGHSSVFYPAPSTYLHRQTNYYSKIIRLKKCQTACKPGSVPANAGDDHSSGTPVARRLVRPTRMAAQKHACRAKRRHPYLVLLPVGFTVPLLLPAARCALTAPFHPYHPAGWRFAFCGTFPGVTPAGYYPAPCSCGARTFLPRKRERPSSHLTRYISAAMQAASSQQVLQERGCFGIRHPIHRVRAKVPLERGDNSAGLDTINSGLRNIIAEARQIRLQAENVGL